MREIEFRGKRKDNGQWVEGSLILSNFSAFIATMVNTLNSKIMIDLEYYEVDPATVGPFTGRKDIEGEPLYSGDLCTNHGGDITAQIVWNERTLMWGLKVTSSKSVLTRGMTFPLHQYFDPETMETSLKKVGNVFDNPELI